MVDIPGYKQLKKHDLVFKILEAQTEKNGNIFAKGIMYFAQSRFGGLVAGASKPVVFLSRSDTAETKYNTIALGVLLDAIQRGLAVQISSPIPRN